MRTLGFSASLLLGCFFLQAGPTLDRALDSLSSVHQFHQAALSPDGATVAFTETIPGRDGKLRESFVYVKDLRDPSAASRRMGATGQADRALEWSRDGRLVFLSSGDSGVQLQVYVADRAARGKPRKVTDLKGYISDPHWSPDGRTIAVLWIEGLTRVPGPTEATPPDSGVVSSQVYEQRLALVDVATGAVHAISPPEMYVYEFDWSPDGKQLVYLAAPGAGDDNWYIAEVYAVDSSSGAVRHILNPPMKVANVRWSPDGKALAFIGGLMSDEGSTGGDIYVLPAAGGTLRNLTPNRKSSPNWFRWMPSSNQILMTEDSSGEMAISTLDLASASVEQIWKSAETIVYSGDLTNSAVIRNSWAHAPEVWAGRTGAWQQVTHANEGHGPEWGQAKSVEWSSDGFRVQGWLLFPQSYDASKHYPMVVVVHGGPAADTRSAWPRPGLPLQLLSSEGYFVFYPNPRGSYGQGEEFTSANVKDFGHGDLRDILAGVDTVVKDYPVDEKRIGIAGWSYGGYMTMWTVTQTHRFRAAFAGAGIANWTSYYGENAID